MSFETICRTHVGLLRKINEDSVFVDSDRGLWAVADGLGVADGTFRCFWMGDSRAYRLRDGELVRLTKDHSLVQTLVDAGMLTPDEAETHENANLITRAVGVSQVVEVDVVSGDARPGDQFLLASDGLTRLV